MIREIQPGYRMNLPWASSDFDYDKVVRCYKRSTPRTGKNKVIVFRPLECAVSEVLNSQGFYFDRNDLVQLVEEDTLEGINLEEFFKNILKKIRIEKFIEKFPRYRTRIMAIRDRRGSRNRWLLNKELVAYIAYWVKLQEYGRKILSPEEFAPIENLVGNSTS